MDRRKIKKIIYRFADKLRENNIEFEYLILFGSHVKDQAGPHSDIDVAVVSDDFGKNRLKERIKLMKISSDIDSRIEPHPISLKDWKEGWKELVEEIERTGIKITA